MPRSTHECLYRTSLAIAASMAQLGRVLDGLDKTKADIGRALALLDIRNSPSSTEARIIADADIDCAVRPVIAEAERDYEVRAAYVERISQSHQAAGYVCVLDDTVVMH